MSFTDFVRADTAVEIILQKKAGVTVSPIRFYADSSFSKVTDITFTEGELFEIIGQTVKEHFDNTQTQTFRWYKVRSMAGQIGWIYGDNLAVVLPTTQIDSTLKPFFKKEVHFDNGFENAVLWAASVEGHDDHQGHSHGKIEHDAYKEMYIVVTNDKGRCLTLNYANANDLGKKVLNQFYLKDVTNSKTDELITETTIFTEGKDAPQRYIEIYSLNSGALTKIFEERLTLSWEEDVPTPAYSKFVEIEGNEIRVAYIDYASCEKSVLSTPYNVKTPKSTERCLEYVTYTLIWSKAENNFIPLYKESRTPVYAYTEGVTTLRKTTSLAPNEKVGSFQADEKLLIIKHFDTFKVEKGVKKVDNWLYVKHPSGVLGYVKAEEVSFKNIEHATLLNAYYKKTPLFKTSWKPTEEFVSVK